MAGYPSRILTGKTVSRPESSQCTTILLQIIKMKPIGILALAISIFSSAFATSWNEPWHDRVVKDAEYFVFAKIRSFDETKGVTIEILRNLGGPGLVGTITISEFYLLDLCSTSGGHGPEFQFKGIDEAYFFIRKNEKGKYCIATPTAGFDRINDGKVQATYRHSYHQALVPVDIYEKTMAAIFDHYHNESYDRKAIVEFLNKYLSLSPAGFDKDEIETFFIQHVAMETAYHLALNDFYTLLMPFLSDSSNFHNQTSAARALRSYNTSDSKRQLMKIIADTSSHPFVQVICLWTLAEFQPKELKNQLVKISKTASEEENGFGGNIMDPRICTRFPSVKSAIHELISTM
jgi:hypothetical protein